MIIPQRFPVHSQYHRSASAQPLKNQQQPKTHKIKTREKSSQTKQNYEMKGRQMRDPNGNLIGQQLHQAQQIQFLLDHTTSKNCHNNSIRFKPSKQTKKRGGGEDWDEEKKKRS